MKLRMKNNYKKKAACLAIFCSGVLAANSLLTVTAASRYSTYEEYRAGAGRDSVAESAYTVIEISSEEELAAAAKECSLDTWSRDKYIKLTKDVTLQEYRDLCFPSFGGIFDGGGFRITNLRITENGSAMGLFRYVQEGAQVRNLTVEGEVAPGGSRNQAGGIAGVNYGRIYNCSFSGQVAGDNEVGGIAGVNGDTGEIRKCRSAALVSGNHSTGGIAGNNHGTLNNCSNTGDINIHSTEVSYDLEDITMENLEDINSTSNISAYMDTGGIAGISDGKIYYCTNEGDVGYSHVGYNVGGIVGRLHQGYLQNCTNTGHILGRKDVGGIAGQMEPFLEVQYLSGKLQELDRETDKFLDMLEAAGTDIRNYNRQASDVAGSLADNLKEANAAGGRLLGAANDLWYIYNQELTGLGNDLKTLGDELDEQEKEDKENGNIHDVTVSGNIPGLTVSGGDLIGINPDDIHIQVPDDKQSYEAALRRFGDNAGSHITKITSESIDRSGGIRDDLDILNAQLREAGERMEQLSDILGDGSDTASANADALIDQARVLRRLFSEIRDDLFRYEGITIEDASDEAASETEENPGAEPAEAAAGEQTTELENAGQGAEDTAAEDALYDTSSFQMGKITLCINKGTVEADTNVGGIVGQVSTEYDLDPEDDITITGAESFNIERSVKAVIRDSRNLGTVTSKKDYAGGIVGKADFGAVISCESYGDVSSTGGSYVGGIAGGSGYAVRSCYSMNRLSGKNFVGGIVGKGCDIFYSYAYSETQAEGECVGSIAGQIQDEGTLYGNYYVAGKEGGVDGIGYAGGAVPVTYEELCQMENVPAAFSIFTISFRADGKELASYQCGYGESIDREQLPEIPEKEGYYGVWPEFDFDFITGSQILEVQYEKWISVLKSEQTDENGRARLLVEGYFLPGYRLEADFGDGNDSVAFTVVCADGNGKESDDAGVYETNGTYTDPVCVRVLCEKPEKTAVQIQNEDGSYTETECSIMGSYLMFYMDHPGVFRLTKVADYGTLIKGITMLCAALVILLLVLIGKRLKKGRILTHYQSSTEKPGISRNKRMHKKPYMNEGKNEEQDNNQDSSL